MSRIVMLALRSWHLANRVADALSWLGPTLARLTVGMVFFRPAGANCTTCRR